MIMHLVTEKRIVERNKRRVGRTWHLMYKNTPAKIICLSRIMSGDVGIIYTINL